MTKSSRIISFSLSVALLLPGIAFVQPTSLSSAMAAVEDVQTALLPSRANEGMLQTEPYSAPGRTFIPQPSSYHNRRNGGCCCSVQRQAVQRAYQPAYYRSYHPTYYRNRPRRSKLRAALTIAGPAAIGAGVGALIGGKKGAGVGALLGGGGGALYYLKKRR